MNVDMAMSYLAFVEERHRVWEKRQAGEPQPWTRDPIVASRKFTCVYRLLDYGSQFVIDELVDLADEPEDNLMRCFLYRHTGRVEAWRALWLALGRYPRIADLSDVLEAWREYRGAGVTKLKNTRPAAERMNRAGGFQTTTYQKPMFTGAYLVFPQSTEPGTDKLESIVALTKRLFAEGSVGRDFLAATSQAERFDTLRRNKGVADFMSMQTLTDFGYTTEYREDEFVVAGPGAVKGAAAIAPEKSALAVIRWAHPQLAHLTVAGRSPSLMDVQNTLCEFSKYIRFKPSPKPYQPAHPGPQPEPSLPPKWASAA
jgi:hypothetical protein